MFFIDKVSIVYVPPAVRLPRLLQSSLDGLKRLSVVAFGRFKLFRFPSSSAKFSPFPNYWYVTLLTEGPKASVYRTAIEHTITIDIQFPLSASWREHPDLRPTISSPIPGYGQVTGGPEWPAAAIRGASVEHSITIEIQLPFPRTRCEHSDACDPMTIPVSYHWLVG
jgi:hypothetical protein